jgi:hypothetical protein
MRRKAPLGIRQLTREHAEYQSKTWELGERVRRLEARLERARVTEEVLRDRIAHLTAQQRRGAA